MSNPTHNPVERWGRFEVTLAGPQKGNPFLDVQFGAVFTHKHRAIAVDGFYDGANDGGEGTYRVRFMPDTPGQWSYRTQSNCPELDGKRGTFACVAPSPGNHGPVSVRNVYHWAYADGTPHVSIGTTCYAWAHQGDALEEQTLETLQGAPFTKLRMCVFPKHYSFNRNEPVYHPFARDADGSYDWTRFDPAFFQHFEQRVGQLCELGIEADLILFHPYDRWGFATMDAETDDRYLRYLVARLASYRNVWWSMANEYDLMEAKTDADWDRFFRIVQESDPYQHPRSIHNCRRFYDHGQPWVTHCSIQSSELHRAREWREAYRKPVLFDECCYEGNIEFNWGNISAREMVHRFWQGAAGGAYVGHGETYLHPEDVLWWSKGGVLHGESAPRIAFLRQILEEGPEAGLDPQPGHWRWRAAGQPNQYYLYYQGVHQPAEQTYKLPEGIPFKIDVIDTWEMTITPIEGTFEGTCRVELPGKPNLAVRIQAV
jgi:hypothetical protein